MRHRLARREVAPERLARQLALEHGAAEEVAHAGLVRLLDRLRHGVDHEPRDRAVLARVDEASRHLHRAQHLGRGADVDLGDDRRGRRRARTPARSDAFRLDAALGRDREHPIAAQQQDVAVAVERERPGHGAARDVDHAQRLVGDDEDPPAVGLEDVRLVDAELLHVRAGEVRDRATRSARFGLAGDGAAVGGRRHARRPSAGMRRRRDTASTGIGATRPVTPGAAVRALRTGARVVDELRAGGEGLQPRRVLPLRPLPPTRGSGRTTAARSLIR